MDEKSINSIPFDVLLEILQYLPFEDLVSSAQYVSRTWNDVVQDTVFWKDISFKPPLGMKTEKVVFLLSNAPHLKSFEFRDGLKIEDIIDTLCEHNKCINSLSFGSLEIKPTVMNKLVSNFLDLEYIQLPFSEFMKHLQTWAQFPKLKSVKCTHVFQSNVLLASDSPPPLTENDWRSLTSLEVMSEHVNNVFEHMFKFVAKRLISLQLQAVRNPRSFLWIKNCSSLEHLKLNFLSRQLLDIDVVEVFTSLRNLKTLKSLSLRSFVHPDANILCKIFDRNLFPNLRELDLNHCINFTYHSAKSIANACPYLEALYLHGVTALDDSCLQELARCSRLRILDVAGCRFLTEKGLLYLEKCIHLHELNLSWVGVITLSMLGAIAQMKNLCILRVDHSELNSNNLVNTINSMDSMKHLSVYRAKGVDGADLQRLLPTCHVSYFKRTLRHVIQENSTSLTTLELHGISSDVLDPIQDCNHLEELTINFLMRPCFKFHEFIPILQCFQKLRVLTLKSFVTTEEGLLPQLLSVGMPKLQELSLECCLSVNQRVGLVIAANHCKLEKLQLKACVSFDDRGLLAIVSLPLLRELDLSGCLGLTEKGLMHLGEMMSLKKLSISGMAEGAVSSDVLFSVLSLKEIQSVQADNSGFIECIMESKHWKAKKVVNCGREAVFMPSAS